MTGSLNFFSTGGEMTSPPMSYYEAGNNDLLMRRVIMSSLMGSTRNQAALFRLLKMKGMGMNGMSRFTTDAYAPEWTISDIEPRSFPLGASLDLSSVLVGGAFGAGSAISTSTVNLGYDQVVYIRERDTYTSGSTGYYVREAWVRYNKADTTACRLIGARIVGPDSEYSTSSAAASVTGASLSFTTDATAYVMLPMSDYNGVVKGGIEYTPRFLNNFMHAFREPVVIGKNTRKNLLYDGSLAEQTRLKMIDVMRKYDNMIYSNGTGLSTTSNIGNAAMFRGLPWFLRNDNSNITDINGDEIDNVKGQHHVVDRSTVEMDDLNEMMEKVRPYGDGNKILVGKGSDISRIKAMGRRLGVLQFREKYHFADTTNIYTELDVIPTDSGNLYLLADDECDYVKTPVYDGTTFADGSHTMAVIDDSVVHIAVNEENGEVLPREIYLKERNNDQIGNEVRGTQTLVVEDPRACGYFAMTK